MSANNALETLLKGGKRPLFMAHMIAGYPPARVPGQGPGSNAESEKVAEALVKGGADIIELQIPFSDPMADGPTIAVACEEALKAGATVAGALEILKNVATLGKPVAVMSYTNPIFRFGIEKFVKTIAEAGATALIVPDCPFDTVEGQALAAATKQYDVCLIPVVSPGVPEERLKQLAKDGCGFVYCTSRQGITGATSKFAGDLADFAALAKRVFNLPLAVGFGVKSRQDVVSLSKIADIAIAGSVFVNAGKAGKDVEQLARELTS